MTISNNNLIVTLPPDKGFKPLAVGLKVQRSTTELIGLRYVLEYVFTVKIKSTQLLYEQITKLKNTS